MPILLCGWRPYTGTAPNPRKQTFRWQWPMQVQRDVYPTINRILRWVLLYWSVLMIDNSDDTSSSAWLPGVSIVDASNLIVGNTRLQTTRPQNEQFHYIIRMSSRFLWRNRYKWSGFLPDCRLLSHLGMEIGHPQAKPVVPMATMATMARQRLKRCWWPCVQPLSGDAQRPMTGDDWGMVQIYGIVIPTWMLGWLLNKLLWEWPPHSLLSIVHSSKIGILWQQFWDDDTSL